MKSDGQRKTAIAAALAVALPSASAGVEKLSVLYTGACSNCGRTCEAQAQPGATEVGSDDFHETQPIGNASRALW